MQQLNPDSLRLIVFFTGLFFFGGLESLLSNRKWKRTRLVRWRTHALMAIFNTLFMRFIVSMPYFFVVNWISQKQWGLFNLIKCPPIVEITICLVLLDFLDYWWHRWNHLVKFLWRFHQVHHNDTEMDVSTSLRFHPGEFFFSACIKLGWIALLGPSIWAFAIFEAGISLASQFHHSNTLLPKKLTTFLEYFIVTPHYHTSHHTVARRTGDANFSTIFIWWDKLFGSYQRPEPVEMQHLGLAHDRDTDMQLIRNFTIPFIKQVKPSESRKS